MRPAKMLAIVACGGVLLLGVIASARHASAQDTWEIDPDAARWSADIDAEQDSSAEAKGPPLDIHGCWAGTAQDKRFLEMGISFEFNQNGNGTKLESSSSYDVGGRNFFALGNMKGSVNSKGLTFRGHGSTVELGMVHGNCSIEGRGTGEGSVIRGKYKFHGLCAKLFRPGTFSISPMPCGSPLAQDFNGGGG